MIFNKELVISGNQTYSLTAGDVIVVKAKGIEEFKYKVPDNLQGDLKITISGSLTEINPT